MAVLTDERCAFSRQEVRRRRKANGQRVKDVAPLVGCSVKTMWFWESGRTEPSAANVARLAAVLRCHPGDLYLPVA